MHLLVGRDDERNESLLVGGHVTEAHRQRTGDSTSFTVTLEDGTYEIYCPVDGHKDMGMVGTLTVGAGGGGSGGTVTDDDTSTDDSGSGTGSDDDTNY